METSTTGRLEWSRTTTSAGSSTSTTTSRCVCLCVCVGGGAACRTGGGGAACRTHCVLLFQEVDSHMQDWEEILSQVKRTRKPYLELLGGGDKSKVSQCVL